LEKKAIPIIFIISILVLAVPFSAFGIVYDPVIEIVSPIPETFGNFGRSVSISGHNVLVGHVGDNTGADSAGAAYIYDSDGNLLLTILNPTPVIGDNFGNAVSIDGNNVLVGVQKKDTGATDAGVAYYFDITTCDADDGSVDGICEAATLEIQNPTPVFEDWFGYSVSISGNNEQFKMIQGQLMLELHIILI